MSPGFDGDIFSLSGDALYEGRWRGLQLLRANAGIDVRLTAELEANACHGLEIAVGARASAEAKAALAVFVAAAGEASAFAQAGATVKVTLAPDLFGRFGLVADVGAYAEASVAGRLSIGLDVGQIRSLAEAVIGEATQMPAKGLALDVFNAFLDELQIGAGVWGRASFSAMARAHLEVYGSIADPKRAGFVFEVGGAAALEGGTGWDFFAFARLVDVHRFYARASDLITAEVVRVGREKLDARYRPALQLVDLCLPAVMQVALVAGQTVATQLVTGSDEIVRPTVRAVLEQMRRFMLRKFVEAGERALSDLVGELTEIVRGVDLDDGQRETLREKVAAISQRLRERDGWSVDLVAGIASDLSDVAAVVAPEAIAAWRQPLTVAWCGLAAVKALDEAGGFSAGVGVGVLGFGGRLDLREEDFDLKDVPDFVLDEFAELFGARPATVRFSDVVDYVGTTSFGSSIDAHLPDLSVLLDLFEEHLDLSPGDFVSACLLGTAGGNLSSTQLYQKLRTLLRRAIDERIDAALLPELRARLGPTDDARLYVDEVVQPSLLGCTNFVFERIDRLVAGNLEAIVGDSLRVGLSALVYKVFARNVIVLGHILIEHVLVGLRSELGSLRNDVEQDPDHVLVTTAQLLTRALVPGTISTETLHSATHRLVQQLVGAGQATFGEAVWPRERRTNLRRLLLEALAGDALAADFHSPSELEALFTEIAECNHVPNAAAVVKLGELLAEVTLDQLRIAITLIAPAMAEFYLALTAEAVADMDNAARAAIDAVARTAEDALRHASRWAREAERLHAEAEALAASFVTALQQIATALGRAEARTEILDRLHADGVASLTARVASITPGWDGMEAPARAAVLSVPLVAYEAAFLAARPLLDTALQVLGRISADIAAALDRARSVDDVAAEIGNAIADAIVSSVETQVRNHRLDLPDEISVADVARVAKSVLITDEVATALRSAYALRRDENDRRLAETDARREEAEARASHAEAERRQSDLLGGELTVRFENPSTIEADAAQAFVYGPRVPVAIQVDGARPSFVERGTARRIFLSINGRPLAYHADDWVTSGNGLRMQQHFRFGIAPLAAGLNVLECSVSDGANTILRREVRFVVDPDAPIIDIIAVDLAACRFDVANVNDHTATEREVVAFKNTSNSAIEIGGWTLLDRAGHAFVFPERTLEPDTTIQVRTGSGRDTNEKVHWHSRNAIWNNRGDMVRLIDTARVLRTEFAYGDMVQENRP